MIVIMSKYYLRNGNLARQFGVLDPVTHLPYSSLFVIGTVLTPPPPTQLRVMIPIQYSPLLQTRWVWCRPAG